MKNPGATHQVQFWCKVPVGTLKVFIRYWDSAAPRFVCVGGHQAYTGITSWTQQTYDFTASPDPSAAHQEYCIAFYNGGRQPATALIDDVNVTVQRP